MIQKFTNIHGPPFLCRRYTLICNLLISQNYFFYVSTFTITLLESTLLRSSCPVCRSSLGLLRYFEPGTGIFLGGGYAIGAYLMRQIEGRFMVTILPDFMVF